MRKRRFEEKANEYLSQKMRRSDEEQTGEDENVAAQPDDEIRNKRTNAEDDEGPRKKKRESTVGGVKRGREEADEGEETEDDEEDGLVTEINLIDEWQELEAPYQFDPMEWNDLDISGEIDTDLLRRGHMGSAGP